MKIHNIKLIVLLGACAGFSLVSWWAPLTLLLPFSLEGMRMLFEFMQRDKSDIEQKRIEEIERKVQQLIVSRNFNG